MHVGFIKNRLPNANLYRTNKEIYIFFIKYLVYGEGKRFSSSNLIIDKIKNGLITVNDKS